MGQISPVSHFQIGIWKRGCSIPLLLLFTGHSCTLPNLIKTDTKIVIKRRMDFIVNPMESHIWWHDGRLQPLLQVQLNKNKKQKKFSTSKIIFELETFRLNRNSRLMFKIKFFFSSYCYNLRHWKPMHELQRRQS